jgi:hypothetical protein
MALPVGVTRLGSFKGGKGDTGSLAFATAEKVGWNEEPVVTMVGPESARGAHFEIPLPLPTPDTVNNDDATESLILNPTKTRTALGETVGVLVDSLRPKLPGPAIAFSALPTLLDNRYFNNSMSQAQDSIVTVGDVQYAVWSNAARHPMIGKRILPDGPWSTVDLTTAPGFISATTALDEHNCYSIAVDADGHIHISGNMHGDWLRYAISTNPHDLSSWTAGKMLGTPGLPETASERLVSYPKFFQHADGTLFFLYRNGASGNGDWFLNRYDTATKTWTRVVKLFDGISASESAYLDNVVVTADGTFHISYQWRPNGGSTADTNDLSYVRSTDKGETWESVVGAEVVVPITHAGSPRVLAATGFQNSCGLSVDTDGHPHIVNFIDEGAVNWQVRHHYWDGAAWVHETVTKWTTTGTAWTPRPRIISAANGRTYVLVTYRYEGWAGKVWAIDVTPGTPRYKFPIADVDLRDSEVTFDSRAIQESNTLHLLVTPSSATPSFTENYWGDEQWSSQWAGVLSIDLDQMEAVANGAHARLRFRTVRTVGAPQPTSVSDTSAAMLANTPIVNTDPEMRGKIVAARVVVQGLSTVAGTTVELDVRELENGVGGNGRTWGGITLINQGVNDAGGTQATPWMPLQYGPRAGKDSQIALFGVKSGAGVGTLYVCTLEIGVLDIS